MDLRNNRKQQKIFENMIIEYMTVVVTMGFRLLKSAVLIIQATGRLYLEGLIASLQNLYISFINLYTS